MPIPDTTMPFAQTYIFASTVRNKLTKQASNPNSSLRVLVTQANMLDNIMDHLAEETDKRVTKHMSSQVESDQKHVSFQLPERKIQQGVSTKVTEYEVGSDSDSDSDSDSYSDDDDEDESDSDSDYYYYSDSEEEEEIQIPSIQIAKVQSFKQLPSMDLSQYTIQEEEEDEYDEGVEEDRGDEEIPELSRSTSLTDDENSSLSDEEDLNQSNYTFDADSSYVSYHDKKSKDVSKQDNLLITRSTDHFEASHRESPNTFAIENIF